MNSRKRGERDGALSSLQQGANPAPDELLAELERESIKNAAFKAVVDAAVDGIITINAAGTIETVNPATQRIFGYSPEELIGHNVKLLMPAPYSAEHDQYLENYQATGNKKVIGIGREVLGRRKDGSTFPLDVAVTEVSVDGRIIYTGTVRDITDRKKADLAIAHLAAIVESSNDVIISKNLDGTITSWNRAAEALFGYSSLDMIGQSILRIVPEDLVDEELGILESVRQGKGLLHFQTRRVTKSGEELSVDLTVSPVHDSTGMVVGASKILRDIGDRVRREEAVRQELENLKDAAVLKSFVEATPDAFITVDAQGTILTANPATELMFGIKGPELIGKSLRVILPDRFVAANTGVEGIPQGTGLDPIIGVGRETIGVRGDGARFPIDLTVSQVHVNGSAIYTFTIRDITEPKRQESVLAQLAAVVESSTDAIFSMSPDLVIETWNSGAQKVYGYTAEEAIGMSGRILSADPDSEARGSLVKSLVDGQSLYNYETVHLAKGQHKVEVAISVSPIRNQAGELIALACISRDVSERKRADEARAYLAAMVESANDAIVGLGLDGIIQSWNEGAHRLFGYTAQEAIGRKGDFLFPENALGEFTELAEASQSGKTLISDDAVRITKEGRRIDVEVSAGPIYNNHGEIIGTSRVARDISERKAQRRALLESENQFRTLAETMPLMMWGGPPDGTLDYINSLCRSFIGRGLEQLEVEGWSDLVHPDDLPAFQAEFQERIATGVGRASEFRILNPTEGIFRRFKQVVVAVHDSDGKLVRWYGLLLDVNDQKEIESILEHKVAERTAELERANRELDAFAYSVSHDLRSPLRHIDGFIELLKRALGEKLDEQSRHYFEVIAGSAGHMGNLIDDLLAFSRMSRSEVTKTEVDLNAIIREVISELDPMLIESTTWKIEQLPKAYADPALMKMVWANLIQNAVKFSGKKESPEIEIGYDKNAEPNHYFIKDNGVGFSMEYVHKLFGVFQRLHRAEEFEGTGIGLANVSRIIQRHGGKVWAEAAPDLGATFMFTLPAESEHDDQS